MQNLEISRIRILLRMTPRDHMVTGGILKGLLLLAKQGEEHLLNWQDDQLWVANFCETALKMSNEELADMARWGWFEDRQDNSWSHFQ